MDISDRFLKVCAAQPNTIAIESSIESIAYKELKKIVENISSYLNYNEDIRSIAILLDDKIPCYASMLGALNAGITYCPINVDLPKERVQLILKKFEPDLIISSENIIKQNAINTDWLSYNNISKKFNQSYKTYRKKNNPAYVIFTSGSTGEPKGVVIDRKSLSNYITWAVNRLEITPESRVSQHPNIGFDLSVLDIYSALCGGGTLVPIDNMLHKLDPLKSINELRLTHWISVPSVVNQMMAREEGNQNKSVKYFIFCGEPLYEKHVKFLFDNFCDCKVLNTYGPTEATVSCSELLLTQKNYQNYCNNTVSIGKPIDNVSFDYIFYDGGSEIPEFELNIVGGQVALGYFKDELKTKERFYKKNEQRVFKTGDLFYLRRGSYYFSRRIDRQVKINGYRIELDEIDNTIEKITKGAIAQSVIHNNSIITFISKKRINIEKLKNTLKSVLPHYSIPSRIIFKQEFPRNANDKIDVNRLKEQVDHD